MALYEEEQTRIGNELEEAHEAIEEAKIEIAAVEEAPGRGVSTPA
jgi:hypothetical protein